MKKAELKYVFEKAKELISDVILELTVPGSSYTEIIVVKAPNLDLKWKYYDENYDEDMQLKRCKDIKIIDAVAQIFRY